MPIDPKQLLKRYERLRETHRLWCTQWQDLADYIHPRRSYFTTVRSPGAKQTEKLYDSTALDAHDRLAATLNGTLTSRAAKWFTLKMRDDSFDDNTEVQGWLEECSKRMFHAFNQSNFAQEVHEVYLDEVAFGTAGLFLEERNPQSTDFAGFIFRSMALSHFVLDENSEGRVDTIFRNFIMSVAAAVSKWGIADVGPKIQKKFEEGKLEENFEFVHAILPRMVGVSPDPKIGTPNTKLPFASAYIGLADKNLITESGFHEFPAMVPRWSKSTSETYGRGPGHLALPDIKTLNKVKELGLKTWAKTLDMPTVSRDDGVVGKINATPGGNTVVRDMDFIKPLYPPGMFREAIGNDQIKSQDLQASIRRYFFADQMELPVGPAMTAFEVAKRFELLQRLLGPTMGRQETELLNPLIERSFGIMLRHNALPQAPVILQQNGAQIDVQYEGPLAKSQRLSEVEGMERLQTILTSIAQVDPAVLDNMDFDECIRIAADVLGVPTKILRNPDDMKKVRDQRTQQQAQMQQLSNVSTVAQAAGKAAPALKLMMPQGGAPPNGAAS